MPRLYGEAFQDSQVLAGRVLIGKEEVELVGLPRITFPRERMWEAGLPRQGQRKESPPFLHFGPNSLVM